MCQSSQIVGKNVEKIWKLKNRQKIIKCTYIEKIDLIENHLPSDRPLCADLARNSLKIAPSEGEIVV